MPGEASSALGGAHTEGLLSSLRATVSHLKATAQKQQRDLSRSMEPTVQTQMTPGYTAATAEAGTGSHRRRVAKLEGHIEAEAPKMFAAAIDGVRHCEPATHVGPATWHSHGIFAQPNTLVWPATSHSHGIWLATWWQVVEQMEGLSTTIGDSLRNDVVKGAHEALRVAYCPLWDELGDANLQARRALAPRVQEVLLEARNAVRRLAASGKDGGKDGGKKGGVAADGGGGEDDDDELVDVTEAAQQAKRARQEADTITLDDGHGCDSDEWMAWGAQAENAPPQAATASGKVKSEHGGA